MRIFILEDNRTRMCYFNKALCNAVIDHAKTAAEAYDLLRDNTYDAVFLDHDLDESGIACGCGADVSRVIGELSRDDRYPSQTAVHVIHSLNPVGAIDMGNDLRGTGIDLRYCTYAWTEFKALDRLITTGEWLIPDRQCVPLSFD